MLSGTIYAFFIQSWAQRYTTSTHAAILLGFEAVFAALAGASLALRRRDTQRDALAH